MSLLSKITNHAMNAAPDRILDARVAAGTVTTGGALLFGLNAEQLTQAMQLTATACGVVVTLLTGVYVLLGIIIRRKQIKQGKFNEQD